LSSQIELLFRVLQLPLSLSHIVLVSELKAVSIVSWLATAVIQRPFRRQNEPEEVHPHGHVPLGGFATAS
jgi:hypothetical protein